MGGRETSSMWDLRGRSFHLFKGGGLMGASFRGIKFIIGRLLDA